MACPTARREAGAPATTAFEPAPCADPGHVLWAQGATKRHKSGDPGISSDALLSVHVALGDMSGVGRQRAKNPVHNPCQKRGVCGAITEGCSLAAYGFGCHTAPQSAQITAQEIR